MENTHNFIRPSQNEAESYPVYPSDPPLEGETNYGNTMIFDGLKGHLRVEFTFGGISGQYSVSLGISDNRAEGLRQLDSLIGEITDLLEGRLNFIYRTTMRA